MTSDDERKADVDPNLGNKLEPSTSNTLGRPQELVVVNPFNMPPSEVNYLYPQLNNGSTSTVPQEVSKVDGSLCSKNSLRPPSSTRPHQVDAVHPLFNRYRSVVSDKSTSTEGQVFYCRQCEISFELCQEAVNKHFTLREHIPIENKCVYCDTAVYEYFYNENVCYYHRCPIEQQQHPTENPRDGLGSNISSNAQETVKSVLDKCTGRSCCDPS